MNQKNENIGNSAGTEDIKQKKSKYDSAWKSVIRNMFEYFFEFFYPEIHAAIDYSKGIEFLDKELKEISPDSNQGDRIADVLVRVHLKDGSTKYICIVAHIEVQGTRHQNFMERMFIYFYRAYDNEKEKTIPVISIAMLTDDDDSFRMDRFEFNLLGFELRMKIPMVKILDYKLKDDLKEKLETSTNPMAMVVKAQLKGLEVKQSDDDTKFEVTKELIRQLYRNGYPKNETRIIMNFISWVIRVPKHFKDRIARVVIKAEEESKMEYVAPWLRGEYQDGWQAGIENGIQRGRQEGIQTGIQKGRLEGREEAKLETAREFLRNGVNIDIVVKSTGLSRDVIEKLLETVH